MSKAIFKLGKGTYKDNKTKVFGKDIIMLDGATNTSELINDGESGIPFATIGDLTGDANGSGIIYGNGAAWKSGYIFDVTEHRYLIRGKDITALAEQLTLDASHATLNRIDVIVGTFDVNGVGYYEILKGVDAVNPIKKIPNPDTQIEITFINVDAATTSPSAVTTLVAYDENIEFTTASSGTATVDFNDIVTPYNGTKCIDVTGFITGDEITLTKATTFNVSDYSLLQIPILATSYWNSAATLQVGLYNGATQVSNYINITSNNSGSYTFESGLDTWTVVQIPITSFNLLSTTIDKISIKVIGEQSPLDFKLDLIRFQAGISIPLSTLSQDLQSVTTNGAISTIQSTFGGLISNREPVIQNDAAYEINRNLALDTFNSRGFRDNTVFSSTIGKSYASFDDVIQLSGTVGHITSFQSRPNLSNTILGDVEALSTGTLNCDGATITNLIGVRLAPQSLGTGVVTNNYGLLMEAGQVGTNKWAVYAPDADINILFGGDLQFKGTNFMTSIGKVEPIADTILNLPAKGAGTYTIATLEDPVANLQKEVTVSYSLVEADNGYTIFLNSATPITITVDTKTTANFECDFYNLGAGTVTFAGGTAIVGMPDGATLATDKVASLLRFMATTTYKLKGELA